MNPLKKKPRTRNYNPAPSKPEWLKIRLRFPTESDSVQEVRSNLETTQLHTVCESASCPNLNHCWSRRTATYMIAGDICTRRCYYCDVATGKPFPLDPMEPIHLAESAEKLNLKHVVITAVNRDDVADGGARHFARTIQEIRKRLPNCQTEVLIPDFQMKRESLDTLYDSQPDIINHNVETVERLFPSVCPQKKYERSLQVLEDISSHGFRTKSGLILGLGETIEEARECMRDLRKVGVQMLTIGQYMQPTPTHLPVSEYIKPEVFDQLAVFGKELGFMSVFSGPLVRSSYHADEQVASVGQ